MMKRGAAVIFVLTAIFLAAGRLAAEIEPAKKIRVGTPPFQLIKDVMRHNAGSGEPPQTKAGGPLVTWLADPDERIASGMLLPDGMRGIYSVRNTANQFAAATGAVDYGVRELLTPLLLITGNTDSRAIAILQSGSRASVLEREIDSLRQALKPPPATAANDEERRQAIINLVQKNVDQQVRLCVERYGDRIAAGRLAVVGAVLDLDDSYGLGVNRLVIININGDTDPASILRRPEAITLREEERRAILRHETMPAPTEKAGRP